MMLFNCHTICHKSTPKQPLNNYYYKQLQQQTISAHLYLHVVHFHLLVDLSSPSIQIYTLNWTSASQKVANLTTVIKTRQIIVLHIKDNTDIHVSLCTSTHTSLRVIIKCNVFNQTCSTLWGINQQCLCSFHRDEMFRSHPEKKGLFYNGSHNQLK